jgi:two-component sensor histidine kinase
MKKISLLFFLFFLSFSNSYCNKTLIKSNAERFVVQNLKDSALVYIHLLSPKKYASTLERIVKNKASYSDYLMLIRSVNFYSKIQYQQLSRFLNKRVKIPKKREEVNLDYVILKSNQIGFIANELELKDANKESEKLKRYLKSIKQKTSTDYKRAELYAELHKTLLKVIKIDKNGLQYTQLKVKKAFQLKDTILALNYRSLSLNFYMYQEDLKGYINAARKSLEIENQLKEKSPLYEATIANLLDALIFDESTDRKEIEDLLFLLYNSPKFHYQSFSLYAKYVGHLKPGDPALQTVFNLFDVKNVTELSNKLYEEAKGKVNPNELYFVLAECSMALFYHQDYANCFYFKNDQLMLNKTIYSSELSQTIADYQTKEIELEKEFKIQQEKDKNKFYLIILAIVAFFLIVSIYLLVLYLRKSNILAVRNKEKDTLLREIHHRVKNNFELVNTLLDLQSGDVESQLAKEKLSEGQSRISSMSLIHQKLYQTEYLEDLDFQEYTEQLVELILKSANKLKNTKLNISTNGLKLDIDTAIPLGLILNELCTNSCKYAFSDSNQNTLDITIVKQDESFYKLTYSDSGTNEIIDSTSKPKGIGMLLIKSLTKQLQGKSSYTFNSGAHFEILFKNRNQRKEIE